MALVHRWIRSSHAHNIVHNWQRLLSHLLWTIILLQVVYWLSIYWSPQARLVVIATLWTTFALGIISPTNKNFRIVLQCLAQVVVLITVLDIQYISYAISFNNGLGDALSSMYHLIYDNAALFFPYVWFSVVTWLVSLIIVPLTAKKETLFLALILSIIFFAALDSFTVQVLWQQIAIIVFCGLLLAINQHFSEFAQNHPTSWNYVKEYPGMMLTFVIVIVSLTMLVGILAPNVRPLLVDPYTTWKHMQGEEVPRIGKGNSQFTPHLRGESASGYRRDDANIGEGFRFDYSVIMTLTTTYRSYLRGETRSLYTGSGWEMSESEEHPNAHLINKDQTLEIDANTDDSKLETHEVQQRITLSNEAANYPVLFGGYTIEKLMSIDDEENVLFPYAFWSPRHAVVLWQQWDDYYPQTYELISQMPIMDVAGLRTTAIDEIDTLVMAEYLQLPDHLPARVTALAQDITQLETNQYDQAKALESYLALSFPYTNEPDLSKGESADFVDRFLFEIQEGYCDYYSTSMVVLARSLGIPARWVKGYSSGVLPTDEFYGLQYEQQFADPDAGGEYRIRNADAHSWVEIYFEGWGWIPFEPTAGFSLPIYLNEEETPSIVPEHVQTIGELEDEHSASFTLWLDKLKFPLFILFIIVIIVASRRKLKEFWTTTLSRREGSSHNVKVIREFNRLVHVARRKGYMFAEHDTAREIVQRWIVSNTVLKNELKSFLNLFERAKYSETKMTVQQYDEAMMLYKKLRAELK